MKSPKAKRGPVQLHSVFLCDLVRREEGGKKLLIGCYSQAIAPVRRPAVIAARVVGAFRIAEGFAGAIEYRVDTPTMVGEGRLEPPPEAIESPGEGFGEFEAAFRTLAEDNGVVEFSWRAEGGEWSDPIRWPIVFTDAAKVLPAQQAQKIIDGYWDTAPGRGALRKAGSGATEKVKASRKNPEAADRALKKAKKIQ